MDSVDCMLTKWWHGLQCNYFLLWQSSLHILSLYYLFYSSDRYHDRKYKCWRFVQWWHNPWWCQLFRLELADGADGYERLNGRAESQSRGEIEKESRIIYEGRQHWRQVGLENHEWMSCAELRICVVLECEEAKLKKSGDGGAKPKFYGPSRSFSSSARDTQIHPNFINSTNSITSTATPSTSIKFNNFNIVNHIGHLLLDIIARIEKINPHDLQKRLHMYCIRRYLRTFLTSRTYSATNNTPRNKKVWKSVVQRLRYCDHQFQELSETIKGPKGVQDLRGDCDIGRLACSNPCWFSNRQKVKSLAILCLNCMNNNEAHRVEPAHQLMKQKSRRRFWSIEDQLISASILTNHRTGIFVEACMSW